jgi:hypothetical protein
MLQTLTSCKLTFVLFLCLSFLPFSSSSPVRATQEVCVSQYTAAAARAAAAVRPSAHLERVGCLAVLRRVAGLRAGGRQATVTAAAGGGGESADGGLFPPASQQQWQRGWCPRQQQQQRWSRRCAVSHTRRRGRRRGQRLRQHRGPGRFPGGLQRRQRGQRGQRAPHTLPQQHAHQGLEVLNTAGKLILLPTHLAPFPSCLRVDARVCVVSCRRVRASSSSSSSTLLYSTPLYSSRPYLSSDSRLPRTQRPAPFILRC